MKSSLRTIATTATLSAASLCFAMSSASANMVKEGFELRHNIIVINSITPIAKPQGVGDLSFSSNTKPFGQLLDKPFAQLPLSKQPVEQLKRPTKKNEFFALATLFNDKLQQMLASFSPSASIKSDEKKDAVAHANSKGKTCKSKRG